MKYTLSRLDAKHVKNAKVVLKYREVHVQSVLQSISVRRSRTTQSRKDVDITLTSCSPQVHSTFHNNNKGAGALMLSSSCLDGSVTPVSPSLNPQYTGAPKAGGGCGLLANNHHEPIAHVRTRTITTEKVIENSDRKNHRKNV